VFLGSIDELEQQFIRFMNLTFEGNPALDRAIQLLRQFGTIVRREKSKACLSILL
jgi:hypothetical protein